MTSKCLLKTSFHWDRKFSRRFWSCQIPLRVSQSTMSRVVQAQSMNYYAHCRLLLTSNSLLLTVMEDWEKNCWKFSNVLCTLLHCKLIQSFKKDYNTPANLNKTRMEGTQHDSLITRSCSIMLMCCTGPSKAIHHHTALLDWTAIQSAVCLNLQGSSNKEKYRK